MHGWEALYVNKGRRRLAPQSLLDLIDSLLTRLLICKRLPFVCHLLDAKSRSNVLGRCRVRRAE